jgi:hypothetical protein
VDVSSGRIDANLRKRLTPKFIAAEMRRKLCDDNVHSNEALSTFKIIIAEQEFDVRESDADHIDQTHSTQDASADSEGIDWALRELPWEASEGLAYDTFSTVLEQPFSAGSETREYEYVTQDGLPETYRRRVSEIVLAALRESGNACTILEGTTRW